MTLLTNNYIHLYKNPVSSKRMARANSELTKYLSDYNKKLKKEYSASYKTWILQKLGISILWVSTWFFFIPLSYFLPVDGHIPFPIIRPVFMVGTVNVNSCRPPGGPMFQLPWPRPRPRPPPCPGGPPAWTLLRRSDIISAACWAWSGGPIICAILSGELPSSGGKGKTC